jgi:hypothetical protein
MAIAGADSNIEFADYLLVPRTKPELDDSISKLIQALDYHPQNYFNINYAPDRDLPADKQLHLRKRIFHNLLLSLGSILDNSPIKHLFLHGVHEIGQSAPIALATILQNRTLGTLDLSSCQINKYYLNDFAENFKDTDTHVLYLDLSNNNLSGDVSIAHIINLIEALHVSEIRLRETSLSFDDIISFIYFCYQKNIFKVHFADELSDITEAQAQLLAARLRETSITVFQFEHPDPKVQAIINEALQDNVRDAAFVATPHLDGQMAASKEGQLPTAITDLAMGYFGGALAMEGASFARAGVVILPSQERIRLKEEEHTRLVDGAIAKIVAALKESLEAQIARIKEGNVPNAQAPIAAVEAVQDAKAKATLEKTHPLWRNALPRLPEYWGKLDKEQAEKALTAYTLALEQIPNIPGLIKSGQNHIELYPASDNRFMDNFLRGAMALAHYVPAPATPVARAPDANEDTASDDEADRAFMEEIRLQKLLEGADRKALLEHLAVLERNRQVVEAARIARKKARNAFDTDSDDEKPAAPASKTVLQQRVAKFKSVWQAEAAKRSETRYAEDKKRTDAVLVQALKKKAPVSSDSDSDEDQSPAVTAALKAKAAAEEVLTLLAAEKAKSKKRPG